MPSSCSGLEVETGVGPRGLAAGAALCSQRSAHGARLPSPPERRGASLTLQLLPKHGQEDSEVDGSRRLLHHGFQLLVLHIDAAWGEGDIQEHSEGQRGPCPQAARKNSAQDQGLPALSPHPSPTPPQPSDPAHLLGDLKKGTHLATALGCSQPHCPTRPANTSASAERRASW